MNLKKKNALLAHFTSKLKKNIKQPFYSRDSLYLHPTAALKNYGKDCFSSSAQHTAWCCTLHCSHSLNYTSLIFTSNTTLSSVPREMPH